MITQEKPKSCPLNIFYPAFDATFILFLMPYLSCFRCRFPISFGRNPLSLLSEKSVPICLSAPSDMPENR